MEVVYFFGALVLLVALIYRSLQYQYRSRAAVRVGGEVARERCRRDEI
jgi:cytochrome bd-type quinol oxidase subunit 2